MICELCASLSSIKSRFAFIAVLRPSRAPRRPATVGGPEELDNGQVRFGRQRAILAILGHSSVPERRVQPSRLTVSTAGALVECGTDRYFSTHRAQSCGPTLTPLAHSPMHPTRPTEQDVAFLRELETLRVREAQFSLILGGIQDHAVSMLDPD